MNQAHFFSRTGDSEENTYNKTWIKEALMTVWQKNEAPFCYQTYLLLPVTVIYKIT